MTRKIGLCMSKAKKGTSEDKNLDNLEAFEKRKRDEY